MHSAARRALLLVLVALMGGAASIVTADSSTASLGEASVHLRSLTRDPAAVRRYWTSERMRNARPLPLPTKTTDSKLPLELSTGEGQTASIFSVEAGLPEPEDAGRSTSRLPTQLQSLGAGVQTHAEGFSTSTEPVANPAAYPYSTHGKIFAHDPAIGDYVCSATVVPSEAGNLVWTAGHCLTNEGVWADWVQFVPAYDYGTAPYGEWTAEWIAASPEWAVYNNFNYDYGYIVLNPNAQGEDIADVVGWRGILFNQPREQTYYAFGYPADYPFDGESAWTCESPFLGNDPFDTEPGPAAMAIDCAMNEGASGGGWVVGAASTEDSYLNSVNSFAMDPYPNTMFGPYLDSDAQALWEEVATTATPTPVPTPTESVDIHEMALSLNLRKHVVARGVMTAPDGYAPCTRGAPVGIFRKSSSGWKLIKTTQTNDFSRYKVRLRDRIGRYAAYSVDGYVDDLNYCTDAISVARVHRH